MSIGEILQQYQNIFASLIGATAGLKHLASSYGQMGIQSIAMPALGCGLGGLKWSEVQPLIVKHLGGLF